MSSIPSHDENIDLPFIKWVQSVAKPVTNVVIFAPSKYDMDLDSHFHIPINDLKSRIKYRIAKGLDTSKECDAFVHLSCRDCVMRNCGLRTEKSFYGEDPSRDVRAKPYRRVGCVKDNFEPIIFNDPEDIQEFEVDIEYNFDITPLHRIKDTLTVDAVSYEMAEEKACRKLPNAIALKSRLIS